MITKLFSTVVLLFLISPGGISLQQKTKVPSKTRNVLSKTCVNKISQSSEQCTESARIKWHINGTDDQDHTPGEQYCCSLWDIADCVRDNIQQKCSPMDKLKNKWNLQQLIQFQSSLGCSKFRYHSEQCGYKDPVYLATTTTIADEIEASTIYQTTQLKIHPTYIPYSNKCNSLISNVGIQCRDEIVSRNNLSIIHMKMSQGENGGEGGATDDCCSGWESILCIEKKIKVNSNCTKEEVTHFHDSTSGELWQLGCPGPEECNLAQDFSTSIGSISILVNFLVLINVITMIIY